MEFAEVDSAALLGLITMVTWGIWVAVDNAASESTDPRTAAAISYFIAALFAFGFIVVPDASLVVVVRGGPLVGVAGLYTGIDLISMYIGLTHGSTTVVSTLGATYFIVTAVTGVVVLGENPAVAKLTGIAFAVLGIVLVTR